MAQLHFYYSSMDAGKSTSLLMKAFNHQKQNLRIVLYTSSLDGRYGKGLISSRMGPQRPAIVYGKDFDFINNHQPSPASPHSIFVDEAQFLLPSQVKQLHQLASLQGIEVLCYRLRTDAFGRVFEGAAYLLGLADKIEELDSKCACGKKATMNIRINSNGERARSGLQVEIGGNDRYRPVCPACFYS